MYSHIPMNEKLRGIEQKVIQFEQKGGTDLVFQGEGVVRHGVDEIEIM